MPRNRSCLHSGIRYLQDSARPVLHNGPNQASFLLSTLNILISHHESLTAPDKGGVSLNIALLLVVGRT